MYLTRAGYQELSVSSSASLTLSVGNSFLLWVCNNQGLILVTGFYYGSEYLFHANVINTMQNAIPTISYSTSGVIKITAASTGTCVYKLFVFK